MNHYVGIDPGKFGAFAVLNSNSKIIQVHDMPLDKGRAATGSYDPPKIFALLRMITRLPCVQVGVEWPNTRPGEGAQRCRNFGLGMGYLEMSLIALRTEFTKIDPQRWKRHFKLPSKDDDPKLKQHLGVYDFYFPHQQARVLGPRGGIKDGRLEAVLIAEYMAAMLENKS